jgi:hypothetical protein
MPERSGRHIIYPNSCRNQLLLPESATAGRALPVACMHRLPTISPVVIILQDFICQPSGDLRVLQALQLDI